MTDSLIIPDGHQSNLPDTQSDNGPDMDMIRDLGKVSALKRRIEGVLQQAKVAGARAKEAKSLAVFLSALSSGMHHKPALQGASMSWAMVHAYMTNYPAVRAIYDVAKGICDVIQQQLREHTADNRAIDGWEEPVWYKGHQVGTIRKYSDRLLETMLTAHDKPKYGKDSTTEVNIGVGISFTSQGVDHTKKAVDVDVDSTTIQAEASEGNTKERQ